MPKTRTFKTKSLQILCLAFLFSGTLVYGKGNPDKGEVTFKMFCMACHHLENLVVGPSLVEIAHLYRKQPEGIVKWSMNPGEKRKGGIRMPPMSHVGEEGLGDVAAYILKVTEGKTFKGNKKQTDPYATFPKSKIQRMFMPDAGPAAIAVSVNDKLHFCWDAGTCQLRYVWSGDYIDPWPVLKGNGNGLTNILGEVFVKIGQGNPFKPKAALKFMGYKKQEGLPIFSYQLDQTQIEVSFEPDEKNNLKVHYKCHFTQKFEFTPQLLTGSWSSDKGKRRENTLLLTPEQGQHFTITYTAGDKS